MGAAFGVTAVPFLPFRLAHRRQRYRPDLNQISFGADGSQVVTTSFDATARLWTVTTGEEQLVLQGHTGFVWSAVFSPDGRMVATAGDDGLKKLWDVGTAQERLTLRSHQRAVYQLTFSPDGERLASTSLDGTVRVHVLPVQDLIELANERVTRSLNQECRRYLHVERCPRS